jgi:hypothetical protein
MLKSIDFDMSQKVAVRKKVKKPLHWKSTDLVQLGHGSQGHAVVIQSGKGFSKFKPHKVSEMTVSVIDVKAAAQKARAAVVDRSKDTEKQLADRLVDEVSEESTDVTALCDEYKLRREELGRLTGFSLRALAEWAAGSMPSQPAKRRLHEVRRLLDSLSEIVKKARISEWLHKPNDAFDGLTPLQVIEVGEIDRLWGMVHELGSDQVS